MSYQRDKFVKLSCNPRHPSRNISCNHRHHLLQPSWRRIFSTSNNQKTRVDSDINSDYKASSFDKLYIRRRKWDTVGFVRAHQRKYWNALTVGRGHAVDGCSCNHRAVPPSESEILVMWLSRDQVMWPSRVAYLGKAFLMVVFLSTRDAWAVIFNFVIMCQRVYQLSFTTTTRVYSMTLPARENMEKVSRLANNFLHSYTIIRKWLVTVHNISWVLVDIKGTGITLIISYCMNYSTCDDTYAR